LAILAFLPPENDLRQQLYLVVNTSTKDFSLGRFFDFPKRHSRDRLYLEFNDENSAATNFRYGPSSGPWIPWCTLIATGYLIDCIEITATIVRLRRERWFESWLKARNKRHQEILDLYRGQLSADFKAGERE